MLALLLLACASPNSCADYSAAAIQCAKDAGADATPYAEETVCGEWSGTLEDMYGAWYQCQAEAYQDGDCSTAEGYVAAANAASECAAP